MINKKIFHSLIGEFLRNSSIIHNKHPKALLYVVYGAIIGSMLNQNQVQPFVSQSMMMGEENVEFLTYSTNFLGPDQVRIDWIQVCSELCKTVSKFNEKRQKDIGGNQVIHEKSCFTRIMVFQDKVLIDNTTEIPPLVVSNNTIQLTELRNVFFSMNTNLENLTGEMINDIKRQLAQFSVLFADLHGNMTPDGTKFVHFLIFFRTVIKSSLFRGWNVSTFLKIESNHVPFSKLQIIFKKQVFNCVPQYNSTELIVFTNPNSLPKRCSPQLQNFDIRKTFLWNLHPKNDQDSSLEVLPSCKQATETPVNQNDRKVCNDCCNFYEHYLPEPEISIEQMFWFTAGKLILQLRSSEQPVVVFQISETLPKNAQNVKLENKNVICEFELRNPYYLITVNLTNDDGLEIIGVQSKNGVSIKKYRKNKIVNINVKPDFEDRVQDPIELIEMASTFISKMKTSRMKLKNLMALIRGVLDDKNVLQQGNFLFIKSKRYSGNNILLMPTNSENDKFETSAAILSKLHISNYLFKDFIEKNDIRIVGLKESKITPQNSIMVTLDQIFPRGQNTCFLHEYPKIQHKFAHNIIDFPVNDSGGQYLNASIMINPHQEFCKFGLSKYTINPGKIDMNQNYQRMNFVHYRFLEIRDPEEMMDAFTSMAYSENDNLDQMIVVEYDPNILKLIKNNPTFPEKVLLAIMMEKMKLLDETYSVKEPRSPGFESASEIYQTRINVFANDEILEGDISFYKTCASIQLKRVPTDKPLGFLPVSLEHSSTKMIVCGADEQNRVCRGTSRDDLIRLTNDTNVDRIEGLQGFNTLDLEDYALDLSLHVQKTIISAQKIMHKFHNQTETSSFDHQSIVLEHFNSILGRKNAKDIIEVDCYLQSIDGKGGKDFRDQDEVLLNSTSQSCVNPIRIFVNDFTKIANWMTTGTFQYFLISKKNGQASISIFQSDSTTHDIFLDQSTESDVSITKDDNENLNDFRSYTVLLLDKLFILNLLLPPVKFTTHVRLIFQDRFFFHLGTHQLVLQGTLSEKSKNEAMNQLVTVSAKLGVLVNVDLYVTNDVYKVIVDETEKKL